MPTRSFRRRIPGAAVPRGERTACVCFLDRTLPAHSTLARLREVLVDCWAHRSENYDSTCNTIRTQQTLPETKVPGGERKRQFSTTPSPFAYTPPHSSAAAAAAAAAAATAAEAATEPRELTSSGSNSGPSGIGASIPQSGPVYPSPASRLTGSQSLWGGKVEMSSGCMLKEARSCESSSGAGG